MMKSNVRSILAMLVVLALVLSAFPVVSFAADATTMVYCQTPDNWEICKIYWWGSTNNPSWPGHTMTLNSDGIWEYAVPTDATGLVINNGSGMQSADLTVPLDENNMYVLQQGTWTTYGKVVITPIPDYTIYFAAPEQWEACNVYWWGSTTGDNPSWPGEAMTIVDGIWTAGIPSDAVGLVFNNGNGDQTSDMAPPTQNGEIYHWESGNLPDASEYTIYVVTPDSWEACNVYWWGSSDELEIVWPGVLMTWDGSCWTAKVPSNADGLVFNDGADKQSEDMATPTEEGTLYVIEDNEAFYVSGDFNDWVENDENYKLVLQDDSTYALTFALTPGVYGLKVTDGTWDYSWGYGDDGSGEAFNYMINVAKTGEITVIFDDYVVNVIGDCLGEYTPDETVNVRVWQPEYAGKAYVYWWGSDNFENPEWPGLVMTSEGDGYWSYDVPTDAMGMVFSRYNGGLQSFDLMVPPYDYTYIYEDPMMFLVGDFSDWGYFDGCDMTNNEDGTVSVTFAMAAGDYQLFATNGDQVQSMYYSITLAVDSNVTFTFSFWDGGLNFSGADVLVTDVSSHRGPALDTVIHSVHAVGQAGLMGVDWDPTANEMVEEDGLYYIRFDNVAAGTYEFKFAANGGWDINWSAGGEMESGVTYYLFTNDINSTVTVTEDNSSVIMLLDLSDLDTITFEDAYGMVLVVAPETGATISGAVKTGGDGETTIELIADGEVVATTIASGKEGTYSIDNVAAGTYTLKVSKLNHVTRDYTVDIGFDALTLDVKIHLIGDVDGNGKINVGDVSKINSHIRSGTLTDEYMILCANVNGGKLNMGDVSTLYAHIKGTKKLY